MRTYLIDNGSLRPASYRRLTEWAENLSERVGDQVLPVSLLHSSKINPDEFGGRRAMVFERQLKADIAAGWREFRLLPFFFGPTAAFTEYIPSRIAALRERFGGFHCERGPFLAGAPEQPEALLLAILKQLILDGLSTPGFENAPVVLVDHGSPQKSVAWVRDRIAQSLWPLLSSVTPALIAASMERRPGPEYAFNEPLLESVLRRPETAKGPVVVAHLFLSPGRHAGANGDIAEICADAQKDCPDLRIHRTALVGDHPMLGELLEKQWKRTCSNPHFL